MKKIIKLITIVSLFTIIGYAKTNWEIYIESPNNIENAKKVNSIEYTKTNYIDRDIQILAKRIKQLDQNSIEVAMQLLLSKHSNFDGYLAPYVRETLSTIIRDNPKLYIDSLKNVKSTKCLAITDTAEEFVDKFIEQLKEYKERKESIKNLPNSHLKSLCINDLNIVIKERDKFIQEETKKSNESYSNTKKEYIFRIGTSCGTNGCMNFTTRISDITSVNNHIKKHSIR